MIYPKKDVGHRCAAIRRERQIPHRAGRCELRGSIGPIFSGKQALMSALVIGQVEKTGTAELRFSTTRSKIPVAVRGAKLTAQAWGEYDGFP